MAGTFRTRFDEITGAIDRPIAALAALAFVSQVGVSIMLPLLPLYAIVSALSNLGVIAGAAIASTAWSFGGPREGLIAAAGFLILAIASLALVRSGSR